MYATGKITNTSASGSNATSTATNRRLISRVSSNNTQPGFATKKAAVRAAIKIPPCGILNLDSISERAKQKYLTSVPEDAIAAFMLGYQRNASGEGVSDYMKSLRAFYSNFKPDSAFAFTLFPTAEQNQHVNSCPHLTQETQDAFKQNRLARSAHRKITDLALANFGFRLVGRAVVESKGFANNPPQWILPQNTEQKKLLMQMIDSLLLLGNYQVAKNMAGAVANALLHFGHKNQALPFARKWASIQIIPKGAAKPEAKKPQTFKGWVSIPKPKPSVTKPRATPPSSPELKISTPGVSKAEQPVHKPQSKAFKTEKDIFDSSDSESETQTPTRVLKPVPHTRPHFIPTRPAVSQRPAIVLSKPTPSTQPAISYPPLDIAIPSMRTQGYLADADDEAPEEETHFTSHYDPITHRATRTGMMKRSVTQRDPLTGVTSQTTVSRSIYQSTGPEPVQSQRVVPAINTRTGMPTTYIETTVRIPYYDSSTRRTTTKLEKRCHPSNPMDNMADLEETSRENAMMLADTLVNMQREQQIQLAEAQHRQLMGLHPRVSHVVRLPDHGPFAPPPSALTPKMDVIPAENIWRPAAPAITQPTPLITATFSQIQLPGYSTIVPFAPSQGISPELARQQLTRVHPRSASNIIHLTDAQAASLMRVPSTSAEKIFQAHSFSQLTGEPVRMIQQPNMPPGHVPSLSDFGVVHVDGRQSLAPMMQMAATNPGFEYDTGNAVAYYDASAIDFPEEQ